MQQPVPAYPVMGAPPPPKKGPPVALFLGIGAFVLLLLVGIVAVAAVLAMAKPSPHLAKFFPKTTSLYVEMPGFKRSLLSAGKMKPLDSSHVDDKQVVEDTVGAFAASFSMSKEAAREVVDGMDASAFGARDTNGSGKAVAIIAFSDANAAERLLKTIRFTDEGPYGGSGGKRYKLARRPRGEMPAKPSALEEMLSDMSMAGAKEPIVWFAKAKLLVLGDDAMITDVDRVLAGGSDSLEQNETYMKAKRSFESGSDMVVFFDTHDFDDEKSANAQKLLSEYLHDRDPITGGVKLVSAGIMMDVHATLSGTAMPPEDFMPHAPKLAFPHKLPADTVAYMAVSTRTKMTSAAIRSMLLERVAESDPRSSKDLKDNMDAMERTMGFSFTDFVDMVGDEVAFAVLLDPGFKLDTTNGMTDEISNFGAVYAIAVKDEAKARMVLGKVRAKLEDKDMASKLKVRPLGTDAFEVDPETPPTLPLPNVTVKYVNKQILVVFASGSLTNRAFEALEKGKGTLGDDKAHELAFGALPQDANFYMWLDTGRITSVMLEGVPPAKKASHALSMLPIEAVKLKGPDRVTTALAVRATSKNGAWAVDLDSLNLPATALFGVASQLDVAAMSSGFGGI